LEFWEQMRARRVYIILGKPNVTAATQEMDQGYATLQPAVARSMDRVVGIKLARRIVARKLAKRKKLDKSTKSRRLRPRRYGLCSPYRQTGPCGEIQEEYL